MARSKLHQKRLRSPFFKKQKNSSNNGQGSIQNIDRAPSSPEFAAQNSAELGSRGAGSDEPARILKRPRLPKKFLDAVAHLGIKNAVPKTIMQLKNDDGDSNGGGRNKNTKKGGCWSDGDDKAEGTGGIEKGIKMDYTDQIWSNLKIPDLVGGNLRSLRLSFAKLEKLNLSGCSKITEFLDIKEFPDITTSDADGDADNDGGDDRDNNGGGGDKDKKKGGGHSDGEGNGDGGDKAEGGDGEEKGMNKDCTGQLGFGYRYTYHAGYENGYPVEQLHALIMFYLFCSENMMNYCSIMPPVRDVSLIDMGLNSADSMQEGRT